MKTRNDHRFALKLKELREAAGYKSQQSFADSFGAAQSTVAGWESGTREPNHETTVRIADFFNVSVDYLLGRAVSKAPSCDVCQGQTSQNPDNVVIQDFRGLPENEKSPALSSEAVKLAQEYDVLDETWRRTIRSLFDLAKAKGAAPELPAPGPGRIRHYLTPAAAGYAAPIEGEDYELIDRTPDIPADADFCIDISGDSMEPYIKDGSRVYVQRGDVEEMRDAGVFYVDGDVFVKQWCVDMIGTLHLLSANPKREDANIQIFKDSGRNVVCFGRVILKKKLPEPKYK